MLSCAAGRMSQTHELGALLLSVCMSPTCVRLRDGRGGGEGVSPRHNAHCWGGVGSVESVATRAREALRSNIPSSIVQKIRVRRGVSVRCGGNHGGAKVLETDG